jgi:CxxC motif-containing protein (DUF1111 family)
LGKQNVTELESQKPFWLPRRLFLTIAKINSPEQMILVKRRGHVYPNKLLYRYLAIAGGLLLISGCLLAQPTDPGLRGGTPGAGSAIAGLTNFQDKFFDDGQTRFEQVEAVANGLGPRFNLTSCSGCHAQPAVGGSSPRSNPQTSTSVAPQSQISVLTGLGLISPAGPVREIRFQSDGGVHDLFTIVGRSDTPASCNISQPDFAMHLSEIIFRIPTPTFGGGLIQAIPEETILANTGISKPFGISGHVNRNGNDGTITRFGWKAQNKSLLIFSGEAYNVEMGISNEAFPQERGEAGAFDPIACRPLTEPNDQTNFNLTQPQKINSDIVGFTNFMRFLAPPTPVSSYGNVTQGSIMNGAKQFVNAGCAVCHIPSMVTGNDPVTALANQTANLFSDLLVHDMGVLGDGISQGLAGPTEFRTAPLWGLGQRVFFLHDGRTTDLLQAIEAHANGGADNTSEAQQVISNFNALATSDKQDILNFLRSL